MPTFPKTISGPKVTVPKGMDYSVMTTKVTATQVNTPAMRASVFNK